MSEVGEGSFTHSEHENIVEIEGPIKLTEGQNFYEQPPFGEIIGKAQKKYGMKVPSDIRHLVTRVSTIIVSSDPKDEAAKTSLRKIFIDPKICTDLLPQQRKGVADYFPLPEIMKEVLGELDTLPHWKEYVVNKCVPGIYRSDGSPKIQAAPVPVYPSSYMAWLEEKTQREQRLEGAYMLDVLSSAFPQQVGGQSLDEVIPRGIDRVVSRKWRLRTGVTDTR